MGVSLCEKILDLIVLDQRLEFIDSAQDMLADRKDRELIDTRKLRHHICCGDIGIYHPLSKRDTSI
jgi:hypothetical protein